MVEPLAAYCILSALQYWPHALVLRQDPLLWIKNTQGRGIGWTGFVRPFGGLFEAVPRPACLIYTYSILSFSVLKHSLLSLPPSHPRSGASPTEQTLPTPCLHPFWLPLDPRSSTQGTKLLQGSCIEFRMAETAFIEIGCPLFLALLKGPFWSQGSTARPLCDCKPASVHAFLYPLGMAEPCGRKYPAVRGKFLRARQVLLHFQLMVLAVGLNFAP